MKSGVAYLAEHPGWKVPRRPTRRDLAEMLRSAASALEHGRTQTARSKVSEVYGELTGEVGSLVVEVRGGIADNVFRIGKDAREVQVEYEILDWDNILSDVGEIGQTEDQYKRLSPELQGFLKTRRPDDMRAILSAIERDKELSDGRD